MANKLNVDLIYPIGSIYMSVNSTNPSTYFGGTWVAWGAGRVPVGVDTTQTEFDTVEETGGEKTHTMTINELVPHNHKIYANFSKVGSNQSQILLVDNSASSYWLSSATGSGQPFNVMQPYITCYMWKRTA